MHTIGPKDSAVLAAENHGPRISASRYFIRFWEPPTSGIFNQLSVDRVLSQLEQSFTALSKEKEMRVRESATAFRMFIGCGGRI
jgi:hypothetical protein